MLQWQLAMLLLRADFGSGHDGLPKTLRHPCLPARQDVPHLQEFIGTWHSSEVVVTCLKASVFLSGAPEAASQAAVEDMLQEAAELAALRHPHVVCSFGTILPEQVSRATSPQLPYSDASCDLTLGGCQCQ